MFRILWLRKIEVQRFYHISIKFCSRMGLRAAAFQFNTLSPIATRSLFVNFKMVLHFLTPNLLSSDLSRPFFNSLCMGIVSRCSSIPIITWLPF